MFAFSIQCPESRLSTRFSFLMLVLFLSFGIFAQASEVVAQTSGSGETGENEDEIEYEPDPRVPWQTESWTRHELLAELCRLTREDDHGDSTACATLLREGAVADGGISTSDADVFELELSGRGLQVTKVEVVAEIPITLELLDASGRVLHHVNGQEVQVVRSLRAGTYFLKLEGSRWAGSYALAWTSMTE